MTRKHAEWLVVLFFAIVIFVVFQQIHTSMTEQGIASGGPYDNAASYPRALAILMGIFVVLLLFTNWVSRSKIPESGDTVPEFGWRELRRPVALIVIFSLYLGALSTLGYHLSTPPMIMAIMVLSGLRKPLEIILMGIGISLVFSFFFEFFLKIVLPGGIFSLNIAW